MKIFAKLAAGTCGALFAVFLLAHGAYAVLDFVEGKMIPTTLKGDYAMTGQVTMTDTWQVVDAKTTSFTVSTSDNLYVIDSSGGAITATLGAPTACAGKEWTAVLKTAGNAVTWSAAPYSINGSVSQNEMDAAGDSYKILCTGAGYVLSARYIH